MLASASLPSERHRQVKRITRGRSFVCTAYTGTEKQIREKKNQIHDELGYI